MIDRLMRRFFNWYITEIVNATIERCAQTCEQNSIESDRMYWMLREIASYPDEDIGVLKYACYAGQSGRDATDIRKLKNGR